MLKSKVEMHRLSSPETQFILKLGREVNSLGMAIELEARNGKTKIEYTIDTKDKTLIDAVVQELEKNEYLVAIKGSTLTIGW